ILPKTEARAQLEETARAVAPRMVVPLLETPRGVLDSLAIASAEPEVPALFFGAEDLTAQLGIQRSVDGEELLFARSQIVFAAAAVGAEPIDAVLSHVSDAGALEQDARRARALGFRRKLAIHPNQVALINQIFSPSPAETALARRIVEAYETASAKGQGVIRFEDRMIDLAVVLRARRVLRLADAVAARRT